MYEKILTPLDGSELAEVVLPYAKELAGRLDLDLILLRVCEKPASTQTCQVYLKEVAERLKTQVLEVQAQTGQLPGGKTVEVRTEVAIGHPAEEILHCAEENKVDMILMATHGYSGVRRWVIGSVADKVLRKSAVPVWLVRAGIPETISHDEWAKRTILVPLDGSKAAEAVLPHIEKLARQRDTEPMNVVLIRVVEPPFITSDYPEADMALSWKQHEKRMKSYVRREARRYLANLTKRLSNAGVRVQFVVLTGQPAEKIIEIARRYTPNLIVLTANGLSGLGGWELGHVADKILHGVSSPVFLIRPH